MLISTPYSVPSLPFSVPVQCVVMDVDVVDYESRELG